MCYDRRWTTINAEKWSLSDTYVVCKQLGYILEGMSVDKTIDSANTIKVNN